VRRNYERFYAVKQTITFNDGKQTGVISSNAVDREARGTTLAFRRSRLDRIYLFSRFGVRQKPKY